MEGVFTRSPSYTFGLRNRGRSSDNTPAPNVYSLPGMLGKTVQSSKSQAPCYTLTGRSKIGSFHEDLQKVILVLPICLFFNYLISPVMKICIILERLLGLYKNYIVYTNIL